MYAFSCEFDKRGEGEGEGYRYNLLQHGARMAYTRETTTPISIAGLNISILAPFFVLTRAFNYSKCISLLDLCTMITLMHLDIADVRSGKT